MNPSPSRLASLANGRRGPAALGGAVIIVVLAGALVANPFATPAASSAATFGPTVAATTVAGSPSPSESPTALESVPPSPGALTAADLDGLMVEPSLAHRLPIFVSIDDARVARPQSGFNAASEVWQAPVDGYESRYLMVFQEADATTVGPVRSARFFFAHWAAEVDGALAHYGGDRLTRGWMEANRGTLFTDIDGIGAGNRAYHRIDSRVAPHNAYTSTADLFAMALKLGADAHIGPSVHVRPFRDDLPTSQFGAVTSISIPYNTETIGYAFDAATDSYGRSVGTNPQIDAMDGHQVTARTVVVLYMPFHTDSTIEPGHDRPVLGFVGTGRAVVYSEGQAIEATWSKPADGAPTRILGSDGQELAFVRGRIFFQAVPTGTKVKAGRLS